MRLAFCHIRESEGRIPKALTLASSGPDGYRSGKDVRLPDHPASFATRAIKNGRQVCGARRPRCHS